MERKDLREMAWPLLLTVLLAGLFTWAYLARPAMLEHMELGAYDLRLQARGRVPDSGRVALVAVDEDSLRRVGRWPWSREVMAQLVERLDGMGVLSVGFDIGFFDPQPTPARDELLALIQQAGPLGLTPTPELRAYLRERLRETNPDGRLALALRDSGPPVVLGYYFGFDPAAAVRDETVAELAGSLGGADSYPLLKSVAGSGRNQEPPVPRAFGGRANIPLLADTVRSQAYFNVLPDQDGTVRAYQMAVAFKDGWYQPLAAALFSRAVPEALPSLLVGKGGLVGAEWGRHVVPTDPSGRMLLNYRGPGGTIPHVPAWRLLAGQDVADLLSGRHVIVGVTAPAVFDMRTTPYAVDFPGPEIHATALDNMLGQDMITRPGWAPLYDLSALWLLCLVCLVFLWRSRPLFTLAGFLAVSVAFLWINYHFLAARQLWLSAVYPLAAFFCAYLGLNVYRFMFEERRKQQVRHAFGMYLDPTVVDQVTENPDRLALGGEKRELTVLFADIVGFTTFAEQQDPETLVQVLNEYLTAMTDVVLDHRGLLDKYVGDSVMAVFGAPLPYEDHAAEACAAALEMQARLETLNRAWEPRGIGPLSAGVGINTGPMVAGNMGSARRLSYTVVGDSVNLASRLEGLTRVYGNRIILSEETRAQVADHFWTRPLDMVRVKGKQRPVELFDLLAPVSQSNPLDYMADYLRLVEAYRAGEFARALELAEALAEAHPEDGVLRVYAGRCRILLQEPPEHWDGVYTLKAKKWDPAKAGPEN